MKLNNKATFYFFAVTIISCTNEQKISKEDAIEKCKVHAGGAHTFEQIGIEDDRMIFEFTLFVSGKQKTRYWIPLSELTESEIDSLNQCKAQPQ
jgi:hypothetical protein